MSDNIEIEGLKLLGDQSGTIILRGQAPLPNIQADVGKGLDPVLARLIQLLSSNSDVLKTDVGEDKLKIVSDRTSSLGRFVRFQPLVDGIPIFGEQIGTQVADEALVRLTLTRHQGRATRDKISGAGDATITKEAASQLAENRTGDAAHATTTSEVWYPADGGLRLAWLVSRDTAEHSWEVVIDAEDGSVLYVEDVRKHANGTGKVFDPNPVVTANDNSFRQGVTSESVLNAERVTVTLKDITYSGGKYTLTGPWVKIQDITSESIAPPEQTSSTFDFVRTEDGFEAAMGYYHVDTIQRYIQDTLGITGVMAWSIPVDAHTLSGGGAYYSPSSKYIGLGGSGSSRPDRGEEGEAILHEYGHAIQDDMVPGWGAYNTTTNRNEAGALGEGFGDLLATLFFYEKGGIYQPEVFEDWVFADVGGLRRMDGTKTYPGEGTTGTTGDWAGEVHDDGEIWGSCIWSAYLAAGGASSSSAVRQQTREDMLTTLILHHDKLATNATFPQAAEALLETNCEHSDIRGRQVIELLDEFHDRNILRNPSTGVDIWMRDNSSDVGNTPVSGNFWTSPDVWVRNADDGGTTHQNPEYGQDNWFYARVRNRGSQTCRAFAVTFEVKPWLGTQFVYPADFSPFIAAAVGFDLAPGATTIVKARWPASEVPGTSVHGCLLANAYCATDEAVSGKHVWESNNLAQRNLHIVDAVPNDVVAVPFKLSNRLHTTLLTTRLEIVRPANLPELGIAVSHPDPRVVAKLRSQITKIEAPRNVVLTPSAATLPVGLPTLVTLDPVHVRLTGLGLGDQGAVDMQLAAGSHVAATVTNNDDAPDSSTVQDFYDAQIVDGERDASLTGIRFAAGSVAGFPITLARRQSPKLSMKIKVPANAKPGEFFDVDIVQRARNGRAVGGFTVRVNVTARG